MQTELIEKEAVRAKFSVSVPSKDVDDVFAKTLRSLSEQVKIPGFRPGKAPKGVLIKRIGEDALAQEVKEALVEAYYPRAVRELDLNPVGARFMASEPIEGAEYSFEVEVELFPEVALPDFNEIVIDSAPREVTDEMVNDTVEQLRFDHATLVPVERPAEAGDLVTIETIDESSGEPTGNSFPVDLERVSADFGDQLVGKTIGDKLDLTFRRQTPADEGETDPGPAAETTETMRVVVTDVKARDKPEADDEFAKTLGFDTWDEVAKQVRASIAARLEDEAFEAQRDEFVDKLLATAKLEVPSVLFERRKRQLLEQLENDLSARETTLESYLANLEAQGKRERFDAELDESADKSVRRDLVLEALLDRRGTTVSDDEFAQALRQLAASRNMDVARLKRELGETSLANYRFLLARDKALRETVLELVARPGEEASATPEEPAAEEGEQEQPDAG